MMEIGNVKTRFYLLCTKYIRFVWTVTQNCKLQFKNKRVLMVFSHNLIMDYQTG